MGYQLLAPPPIQSKIERNQKFSVQYQKYLTNINGTITATLKPINFTKGSIVQTGMAIQAPDYTTDEIDSISNAANGMIVYDNELQKFKFRENGAWEVFT